MELTLHWQDILAILVPIITFLCWMLSRIEKKFEKVDERFEKVDQRFDKVDARLTSLEMRLTRLEGRFDERGY